MNSFKVQGPGQNFQTIPQKFSHDKHFTYQTSSRLTQMLLCTISVATTTMTSTNFEVLFANATYCLRAILPPICVFLYVLAYLCSHGGPVLQKWTEGVVGGPPLHPIFTILLLSLPPKAQFIEVVCLDVNAYSKDKTPLNI